MGAERQSAEDLRATLGRYALFGEIAAGGMASVHLARLIGPVGFSRTVAIKRLHPHLARDPDLVAMFQREARLGTRVRHSNVVATLDVVCEEDELFLVMEYVAGESLSRLVRKTREAGGRMPPRFAVALVCNALDGLHAAHEAKSERGQPLDLVHRDVSPQNIHVGIDGVARVLDFGIARAMSRPGDTKPDQIKGKLSYMSPEQLSQGRIDRRSDVYSASVVLWEALTGERLFKSDDMASLVYAIVSARVTPPSEHAPGISAALDAVVMKGLARHAKDRWSTAHEMAVALERALAPASPRDIGAWVHEVAGAALARRIELVERIESETSVSLMPPIPASLAPSSLTAPTKPEFTSGIVRAGSRPDPEAEPRATAPSLVTAETSVTEIERRTRHRYVLIVVVVAVLCFLVLAVRILQVRAEAARDQPTPTPAPAKAPRR